VYLCDAGKPASCNGHPLRGVAIARIREHVRVLLIHGRDDTVVPYEQSEVMFKALTQAGKKVELVTLNREEHWLSRGETRLLMLQKSIAFLKANNPP
jgi:dipeptidyl aminopeptidase/acylaminoacyl peptidase